MKKFENFITENLEMSGKYSFFNFINVVDSLNLNFFKNDYHKNLYEDYAYFFSTESIKDNTELLNKLKYKRSLKRSFYTLKELGKNKISIFFGVKSNKTIRYGFIDNVSNKSYITGEFSVTTSYFKSIQKYKCMSFIINKLTQFNFSRHNSMKKIEEEFKLFYKNKKNDKIEIDDNKIINYFNKEEFTKEDFDKNMPTKVLDEWIKNKKWKKDTISYFVDEDDEEYVKFIIVLK